MCLRPPCENCGADYDACMATCPKCGHPNSEYTPMINVITANYVETHWCKICKINHTVISHKPPDPDGYTPDKSCEDFLIEKNALESA